MIDQVDEEQRLKEEAIIKDLADAIALDEKFLFSRELAGKGKDVLPTGKQRKDLSTLSTSINFGQIPRRKSSGTFGYDKNKDDNEAAPYFDLNAQPRIFINSGPVSKMVSDNPHRKFSKRFMFLFTDVVLFTSVQNINDPSDNYDVDQVLWVKDLKLRHLIAVDNYCSDTIPATSNVGTSNSYNHDVSVELIVGKTRKRDQYNILLSFEDTLTKNNWVNDIGDVLLAYHRDTVLSKQIGWYHEVIQGTFYSSAYLGDASLLRKHLRLIQLRQHEKAQKLKKLYLHSNNNTSTTISSSSSNDNAVTATSSDNNNSSNGVVGNNITATTVVGAGGCAALSAAAVSLDTADITGMTALHWAALRGHETCVRLLVDRGAEIDAVQVPVSGNNPVGGGNTPLLLSVLSASCTSATTTTMTAAGMNSNNNSSSIHNNIGNGSDAICRLLLDCGANLAAKNTKQHSVVFMAVLFGHSSKSFPWLMQLLHSKGTDFNAPDHTGANPLHYCAQRNLSRPIRMLVDCGANVNAMHRYSKLTPLQLACEHVTPDVETIRSLLEKGAYPNWRDSTGRTAFDIVLYTQQQYQLKKQQLQEQQQQQGSSSSGGLNSRQITPTNASSAQNKSNSSSFTSTSNTVNNNMDNNRRHTTHLTSSSSNSNNNSNAEVTNSNKATTGGDNTNPKDSDASNSNNINNNDEAIGFNNNITEITDDGISSKTNSSKTNTNPTKTTKNRRKTISGAIRAFTIGSKEDDREEETNNDNNSNNIAPAVTTTNTTTIATTGATTVDDSSVALNTTTTETISQEEQQRWRPMEYTIQQVGEWAVKALPALLEICKRGGGRSSSSSSSNNNNNNNELSYAILQALRPSFRAAVEEAQEVWCKLSQPENFLEFVAHRIQQQIQQKQNHQQQQQQLFLRQISTESSDLDSPNNNNNANRNRSSSSSSSHSTVMMNVQTLSLDKANWTKDKHCNNCQLCGVLFNLRLRKHHCRACGVITCDECSSKRLQLSLPATTTTTSAVTTSTTTTNTSAAITTTTTNSNNLSTTTTAASASAVRRDSGAGKDGDSNGAERVCDGCFNRLLHEASQPNADTTRVKQLKRNAQKLINSLQQLVDALDEEEGGTSGNGSSSSAMAANNNNNGSSISHPPHHHQQQQNSSGDVSETVSVMSSSSSSGITATRRVVVGGSNSNASGLMKSSFSFKFAASQVSNAMSTPKLNSSIESISEERNNNNNNSSNSSNSNKYYNGSDSSLASLKSQEARLQSSQDNVLQYLEAAQAYQKVIKKLIDQKQTSNRLWGANNVVDM